MDNDVSEQFEHAEHAEHAVHSGSTFLVVRIAECSLARSLMTIAGSVTMRCSAVQIMLGPGEFGDQAHPVSGVGPELAVGDIDRTMESYGLICEATLKERTVMTSARVRQGWPAIASIFGS